jgi:hypothetical protein
MDRDSIARVNTAVDECLDRCSKARFPLVVLDAFLMEVQQVGSLSDKEVEAVEEQIRRVLAGRGYGD